ncbi:unnamed protein product, partial [Candidula unifasciata]
ISKAKEKIARAYLESNKVKLLTTSREAAVVVKSIDFQKLSEEFLCLYFESEFADGYDIIESSNAWPELNMAVVNFHPLQKAVVEKILESTDLVPLPSEDYHISVHPCYNNFHEYIGQQIHDEVTKLAEEQGVLDEDGEDMGEDAEEQMEEDSEEDDGVSEEEEETSSSEEEDTDESETKEGKNKKPEDDDSESDSLQESDSEIENAKIGSASIQGLNRAQHLDTTVPSKQGSSALRGGFRGRGAIAMRVLTSSARRKSNEENEEKIKDKMRDRSSSIRNASHERRDLGSKYEKQPGKMAFTNGRGKMTDKFQSRSLSVHSLDDGIDVEMKSEVNQINRKKTPNFRGRGGAVYRVSEMGKSFQTREHEVCNDTRLDESEDRRHWNVDAPIFRPNMGKQHSTSCTSLANSDQETSFSIRAGRTSQEETLGVNHNHDLPADKHRFQEVEQKIKNKLESELALKDAKIKQLQEELARKDEQPKQCTEKVEMAVWQKEFLPHCFGDFEDCHISFDGSFAVVEGKSENVKEQQLKLLKELTKLQEKPLEITQVLQSILCKEQGKQYLQSVNTNGAKVLLRDTYLLVVAKSVEALKEKIDFLSDRLNYKETTTTDAEIPTEKLQFLKLKLEAKFLVQISWNDKETEIYIEGIKDDVFEAIREIQTLMNEHADHENSFSIKGLPAKLLHRFCEDKIRQYLQAVKTADYLSTEADIAIKFKGDRKAVQQVYRNLTDLQKSVMHRSWDLRSEFKKPEELMLIVKGFASDKIKKKIDTFEATKKCIVSYKLPSLESFNVGTYKKTQQAVHSVFKQKEPSRDAFPVPTEDKLKLDINNTCQLVIKPYGDITRETSDVLVNLLTTQIDLRKTRVGQAFNKVCHSLRKTLQSEQEAHPTDVVLTTKGPFSHLKCQAICHIVFTQWDPNSSPAQLSTSIQSVITQAVALGAKSVSFPVLGCGKAFRFPPSDVAEITLASIKASQVGQALQKIVLLAPDAELFKEFKSKVSNHFRISPARDAGAMSSSVPAVPISKDEEDESEESDEEESDNEDEESVVEHDLQKSGNAEISITVLHGNGIETIWSALKDLITKVCLHKDYVNQDLVNIWPKDSRARILQEAKKSCVWVEISKHPKTNKPGYLVKGAKQQVEKVVKTINKELHDFSSHLPKNRIKSPKAPKRGGCEFLKHASESDELFPSYWKRNNLNPEKGLMTKLKDVFTSHKSEKLWVSVEPETKQSVIDLINKTWDPNLVGQGNDAFGLTHSKIRVIDVKRIENLTLFELYSTQRKLLFKKMLSKNKICPDIGKIRGSKGRVITTEHLKSFMKEELYYEVNEHYLFHGTKAPKAIAANGIDPRVSNEAGMFGKGIYTAEAFTKADQYTESVKLTRPPCIQCSSDKCSCSNQELYDSVMGDGRWIFREFVVYDQNQCYPEYLISYQRA